ncbi:unnamed protein product [Cuscuta campestris]|uniref:Reverse transcriptase RNase H-like domain-containing protein n=1 Tax=Cuscuta campestris TaxID=132261 RepID=A0A484KX06_9ASTE|nr:unnamed protein product [Cuscuta campestris]
MVRVASDISHQSGHWSPLDLAKRSVRRTLHEHPVYYTAKTLRGAELRYSVAEKTVLAVVSTVQRLTPYFQAHPVQVLSQQPIGALLKSPNAPSRMSKWAVFLGAFQIEFRPRPAIKGQALADFVVECTAREEASPEEPEAYDWWIVFTDGSSAAKNSGVEW